MMFLFIDPNNSIIIRSFSFFVGIIVILFSIFFKKDDFKNHLLKIGSIFIVVGLTISTNNPYIYLVSFFIIGTAITGQNYLLNLIREWKTTTKKNIIEDYTLENKPPKIEQKNN